jgi:hypothetical protein
MASSSSRGLKSSRRNTLSTVQVIEIDQSPNTEQSRRNSNNSLTPGVKNGGVSRRRSAPSARHSKKSQTQTTTAPSQRSRSSLGRNTMELNNEDMDGDEEQYIDDLNISSASATTENMDIPQQHDNDHSIEAIDSNKQIGKTTIKKQELLNQYFTKLTTGGYYCKLCDGTKNSNKVSLDPLTADRKIIQ